MHFVSTVICYFQYISNKFVAIDKPEFKFQVQIMSLSPKSQNQNIFIFSYYLGKKIAIPVCLLKISNKPDIDIIIQKNSFPTPMIPPILVKGFEVRTTS